MSPREEQDSGGDLPEELVKLRDENARLKYRLNILKRATAQEEQGGGTSPNNMPDLRRSLVALFQDAVQEAFPSLQSPPCPVVPSLLGRKRLDPPAHVGQGFSLPGPLHCR